MKKPKKKSKRIKLNKFRGSKAFNPIVHVEHKSTDAPSGQYLIMESNSSGYFVLHQSTGVVYFISNPEFARAIEKNVV